MNAKLQEYLSLNSQKIHTHNQKVREENLIDAGLFEKEYNPDGGWTPEYCDVDNGDDKYFKKIAIQLTDEEYAEFEKSYLASKQKLSKNEKQRNTMSTVLQVIACLIFVIGFIMGIVMGTEQNSYYDSEFSIGVAFIYWFTSFFGGLSFLTFAEILKLLQDIKNK